MTGGLDELRALLENENAMHDKHGRDSVKFRRAEMATKNAAHAALPTLLSVVDAAEKLIIGVTGDNGRWMDEWCVLSDAVNTVKGKCQCSCKPSECVCNLTCHDCGRKITDTESCWGACPECAAKPGYWNKEVHDA